MKYFLAKTEPSGYSIDRLEKDRVTSWNGVRNPQAVNFLKSMQKGDMVFIYHTEGQSCIVGLAEVIGNGRVDPIDAKSYLVDMKFIKKFKEPFVTLKQIKQTGKFKDFRLVRQSRLSVMDVPEEYLPELKYLGLDLD